MKIRTEDTIAAISTAPGEGGIGIIRISGERALAIAERFVRLKSNADLASKDSHSVSLAHVFDPESGQELDEVLVLVMRAPHTYTKEDVVEIQCHGGTMATRQALTAALKVGARIAEPGEFTRRAFMNGRLDLAQAEAVIDVIRATTDAGLKTAVSQLDGGLSQRIKAADGAIADVLAQLEAAVDFSDEDIETTPYDELFKRVDSINKELQDLLKTAFRGRIIKEGLRTIIAGRPNAGKSSLLNALLRRERAIVTDIPGTTRDIIEETIVIDGVPLLLKDTAGLREARDEVERIGIELTHKAIENAELVLYVLDSSAAPEPDDADFIDSLDIRTTILVLNKQDLGRNPSLDRFLANHRDIAAVSVSATMGDGIEGLEQAIAAQVLGGTYDSAQGVMITSARHEQLLEQATGNLSEALELLQAEAPEEIISTVLLGAIEALKEITGDKADADILGRIFSQFCIGK